MTAEEMLLELIEAARAFGAEEEIVSAEPMTDLEREFWRTVYKASRFLRGEPVEAAS